jgi:hypothetical protein
VKLLRTAQSGGRDAYREFAKQVRDPGLGIPSTDIERPFATDRRIDQ